MKQIFYSQYYDKKVPRRHQFSDSDSYRTKLVVSSLITIDIGRNSNDNLEWTVGFFDKPPTVVYDPQV